MTDGRAAVIYGLALIPTGAAALMLGGWIMDLSNRSAPGLPSGIEGWGLNIFPPLVTGLLAYLAVAGFVRASPTGNMLAGHSRRCAVLYLVALGLGAVLLHDGGSADFWSMGQLVLWLWIAAVGGIMADGLTVLRRQ